jgi:phosphate transport system permease protein
MRQMRDETYPASAITKRREMAAVNTGKFKSNLQGTAGRRIGIGDRIFSGWTVFFAAVVIALLAAIVTMLIIDAIPAIKQFGIGFLGSSAWNAVKEIFGALPAIYGTLISSLIALILAAPISFGAAIFLVELSPKWLSGPASFIIEMLAAIPSVIIGLWGIYVMNPAVYHLDKWLQDVFGFLPIFQGTLLGGVGILSGGLILAIMIIPIITAISREAIKAVPQAQREAMLALGATRWEMISKGVLPFCRSSLIGGTILGLGRAMGETMAVLMVIGGGYKVTASLFAPGSTIASKVASNFSESAGLELSSLIELALILFLVTLAVNIGARLMVWRMSAVKAARE